MKAINTKRWLSVLLVLCMAASLFVTPALAAQDVEANPGSGTIPVEYFTSTLYKWDEDEANKATASADWSDNLTTYDKQSVHYNWHNNYNEYTSGDYYVDVNGTKYQVTGIRCNRNWGIFQYNYKWTIEYDGRTITSTEDSITLYQQQTGPGYEVKGFYFTEGNNKPNQSEYEQQVDNPYVPDFSKWHGKAQNFHIYSGLAQSNLKDAENAPFNNDTVNAADLFGTTEYDWKDVYTNVQVPFKYNAETGYYTLNSDENAVYFQNGNAQRGATMVIADKPVHTSDAGVSGTGFQPFEAVSSNTTDSTKSNGGSITAYTLSDGNPTFGFGMVTQVPFQMTDNGKDADGDPIQFRFSGDDDVWVYIDDILVLDIGGTHDAITGTIDFSTGAVTLDALNYDYIGDKATHKISGDAADQHDSDILNQTNLYTALGKSLIEFASEGQHTLTIYYMDRGRGKTNCLIEFNLPQRDSVSVTKHVEEYYNGTDLEIPDAVKNTPFTFQLLNDGYPVSYKAYTLYNASNEIEGSGTTSGTGTFTLTNGQRAVFQNISLDKRQTWQVIETLPSDMWIASWEASSSVTTATIDSADGATSGLVTVEGSDTASDSISFVCTNSYKYQSNVSLNVPNKSIVIDYGLPVEFDVLANASVIGNGEITGFEITTQGQFGTATKNKNGNLVYTLNHMLSEIDTVTYTVHARDIKNDETFDKEGTLTIIPATSMYYEESFGLQNEDDRAIIYQTNTREWSPISDDKPYGTYQETALVGGPSSTYGTDPVYLNNLGDSYGTSRKADVTDGAAQIQYDFTGTGTAIYGRITLNSAYIMVEITNKDTNSVVDKQYIDTVVLTNGSNSSNLSTLYNIPIYNNDTLEYGSYHVRVYIYKAGTPTTHGDSGNEFYLDGIRVYCPLGDQSSEAFPTVADEAYSGHGEANVVTANIRSKLLNDGPEGDTFVTLTDVDGEITDLDRYGEIGPNEELYLKESYSVTFAIKNWNSQQYKMFLGMKAPDGSQGVTVKVGNDTYNIKNSADCYYDISGSIVTDADDPSTSYVTITGVKGLVSLTNIKVTGTDAYQIVTSGDDFGPADPYMLTFMSVDLASSVNGSTEPPVEETPVFEPDRVKTSCVYSRLLRVATVTVTASKDVDYVTINGRTVNGVSLFGSKYFTRSCTGISKGEEIEVVCYNSDGVASQTYTVTAK